MNRLRVTFHIAVLVIATAGPFSGAHATEYVYIKFDIPGLVETRIHGTNDAGALVGPWCNETDGCPYYDGNDWRSFDCPGVGPTGSNPVPIDINNDRVIIGSFEIKSAPQGGQPLRPTFRYDYDSDSCIPLDYPGAPLTATYGISNNGTVVGAYWNSDTSSYFGFLTHGGGFTSIARPGAHHTVVAGVNDAGKIVGWWNQPQKRDVLVAGYYYDGWNFKNIMYPNAKETYPMGINNTGRIVGFWWSDGEAGEHASFTYDRFAEEKAGLSKLAFPGARATHAMDINNNDVIVGFYDRYDGRHGFIAYPAPAVCSNLIDFFEEAEGELEELLGSYVCGGDTVDEKLQGAIEKKVGKAQGFLDLAGSGSEAKKVKKLLRKCEKQLKGMVKKINKARRTDRITEECGERLHSMVSTVQGMVRGLRKGVRSCGAVS